MQYTSKNICKKHTEIYLQIQINIQIDIQMHTQLQKPIPQQYSTGFVLNFVLQVNPVSITRAEERSSQNIGYKMVK